MTPHIRSLMIYDGHGRFRLLMVLYDGLSSTHDEHLPRAPKILSVGNFPNFEGVDGTIGDMIRMPLFRHGVVGTDLYVDEVHVIAFVHRTLI